MHMDLPRILIIDSDRDNLALIRNCLVNEAGYEVPLQASTMTEAQEAIGRIVELGINIVILDARFKENTFELDDADNLCAAIADTKANVKVISITSRPNAPYGHTQFAKPIDFQRLPEKIWRTMRAR